MLQLWPDGLVQIQLPKVAIGLRHDLGSLLSLLVVRDVEELDLKALLGGGNNTQPVTQLLALEVLLGQVLDVALREGDGGSDPDLALACSGGKEATLERLSVAAAADLV